MKKWTLLPILLVSQVTFAQTIYQWTDSQGNTVYSDKPHQGAQEVTVPDLPTYQAPKIQKTTSTQTQTKAAPQTVYQAIAIVSPNNEETIWSNPGIIPVSVTTDPALAKGDKIVITVDGKQMLESTTGAGLELKGIDRGTHSIQAQIVDAGGNVVKTSQAVTVYLHKASVDQTPNRQQVIQHINANSPNVTTPITIPNSSQ